MVANDKSIDKPLPMPGADITDCKLIRHPVCDRSLGGRLACVRVCHLDIGRARITEFLSKRISGSTSLCAVLFRSSHCRSITRPSEEATFNKLAYISAAALFSEPRATLGARLQVPTPVCQMSVSWGCLLQGGTEWFPTHSEAVHPVAVSVETCGAVQILGWCRGQQCAHSSCALAD